MGGRVSEECLAQQQGRVDAEKAAAREILALQVTED